MPRESHEIMLGLPGNETDREVELALTATPVSRRLQDVGQSILSSGGLFSLGEDEETYSTCPDRSLCFVDRLLRAQHTKVPLVEVTLLPEDSRADTLRNLFGINGRLVSSVVRAVGEEHEDRLWGNVLDYERIGLSVFPFSTTAVNDGRYTVRVDSVLTREGCMDYVQDPRDPEKSATFYYEQDHGLDVEGTSPNSYYMVATLGRVVQDYRTAAGKTVAIEVRPADYSSVTINNFD